jgi:decaprenylphospho-beta-D-erythro-pentofuranosid-2-ulose 2-reductase
MRDGVGSVQSVLVLGGGSELALATVRLLVADRTRTVVLAGRKPERFQPAAEELRGLGASTVANVEFDATDVDSHEGFVADVFARFADIDLVLAAFGVHGTRGEAQLHSAPALDVAFTNYVGAVSVLLPVARNLRDQGHGTIVAFSSVAGQRARKANFVYGSSKAGLDAFCQGLGHQLAPSGIGVMVVRPGFVRTQFTAGVHPAPLATTPERVAGAVVDGIRRRADVVWVPPAFRPIAAGLRLLPRSLFRKLEI